MCLASACTPYHSVFEDVAQQQQQLFVKLHELDSCSLAFTRRREE